MTFSDGKMDIDDRIKDIKAQRYFPDSDPLYCRLCGEPMPTTLDSMDEDEQQLLCAWCLLKNLLNFKKSEYPESVKKISKPRCGYCSKVKKLVGKWCAKCRDERHRREIKALLEKKILSGEDEMALEYFKRQPIWKKEFKNA